MKKTKIMIALFILFSATGCLHKKDDHSEKIADMTRYMEEGYGEDFEFVSFEPAPDGWNSWHEESILVLKLVDKDIYTTVAEQVAYPGDYYDDFVNKYTNYLFKDEIDYSKVSNLNYAKTYVSTYLDGDEYDKLKNGDYELSSEYFFFIRSFISIDGEPTEETLKELYEVYLDWNEFGERTGIEHAYFCVGFGGDLEKGKEYINNFRAADYDSWWIQDRELEYELYAYNPKVSFEEFRDLLEPVN